MNQKKLCECGRPINYYVGGSIKHFTNDGHGLCRQCWKSNHDKNRRVKSKKEVDNADV